MNLVNIFNFKQFIYLFLRDPEGNLKCRKIKSFRPYWFEPNPNGKYISFDNVKLEKKIANEPKEVPQLRSDNSYESDIIYTTRYIYDHIDTFDKTMIKWAMIDIEVLTPKGSGVPNTYEAKNPISSITLYNSKYNKVHNWFLGDYYKAVDNKKLAEINMMKDFVDYLKKAKFDLIMGWYMCDFDYPYLYHRFNQMPQKVFFDKSSKYNNFAVAISPIGRVRGSGDRRKDFFYPAGTSIIDYLMLFKKIYKNERSYALDAIMEKYLGKGKKYKDVDFSKVDEVVRQRNIGDVEGMRDLEYKKFKLIPFYDEIRRMARIGWEDLEYPLRIVEPFFFEEAKKRKIILPKRKGKEELTDVEFEGAHRKAYKTGRFFDASEYDISGAYLNTVIDLCLDSANIVEEIKNRKIIPVNVTDRETNRIVDTYLIEQNEEAILPSVAKKLLNEKQRFKDLKNNTNPESQEYKDIEKKYDAIKSIVLSCWGVMGNKYFRLFDARVGGMITSTVRSLLHYTEKELKKLGYDVLYTDTDGVIIGDKGKNICDLLNKIVQQWAQEKFGKSSSIEFEYKGRFSKLFIIALCHYKGYLTNTRGEIKEETKGIEVKRKDSTVFMAKFQDELLNKILNNEEEQSIRTWINDKIAELKSGKIPLMDIAFPAHINKDYDKSTPIFKRALNYTQEIAPDFIKEKGDPFYWIYVEPFGNEIETIRTPYYKGKKLTPKVLVNTWVECCTSKEERDKIITKKLSLKQTIKELEKYPEARVVNQKDMLTELNSKGLIEWKEESKKGKAKNVLAFDENIQDHIKNIDWAQMVARNITNKVEAIFQAQGWDFKGITLQKGLKSATREPTNDENNSNGSQNTPKIEENQVNLTQLIETKDVKEIKAYNKNEK